MMIEFKTSSWRNDKIVISNITVNINHISTIEPYSKGCTSIYFADRSKVVANHTYEEVIKKIETFTNCLKLKDEITSFEEFKKE